MVKRENDRDISDFLGPWPQRGRRAAIGHAAEIFQGVYVDSNGCDCRCLVTLPAPVVVATAEVELTIGQPLRVIPPHKHLAWQASRRLLDQLNLVEVGGEIRIENPWPESKGLGTSTADISATLRATAAALGREMSDLEVSQLAVEVEHASDGAILPRCCLWAQREGRVLEDLGPALPPLRVELFDATPNQLVETRAMPLPDYAPTDLALFHLLLVKLRRAVADGDAALLGEVATISASINDRYLPKHRFLDFMRLSLAFGAVGVAVAHSGTVMCSLVDARADGGVRLAERIRASVERDLELVHLASFTTGGQA